MSYFYYIGKKYDLLFFNFEDHVIQL